MTTLSEGEILWRQNAIKRFLLVRSICSPSRRQAAYFNIGIKRLRRIAEDNLGTVAVYCGNRFLIIRPKFEEFILNSSEI